MHGSGFSTPPAPTPTPPPVSANPTAKVGLTAVDGSAATFMTSDSAPPIDQTIAPTWTGAHTFQAKLTVTVSTGATAQQTTLKDAGTVNTLYPANVYHATSGTAGTLFGVGTLYQADDSTTPQQSIGAFGFQWKSASHGSGRYSQFAIWCDDGGDLIQVLIGDNVNGIGFQSIINCTQGCNVTNGLQFDYLTNSLGAFVVLGDSTVAAIGDDDEESYGTGLTTSITSTSFATFTGSPSITIPVNAGQGRWLVSGRIMLAVGSAITTTGQSIQFELYQTNNGAGAVANSVRIFPLGTVAGYTGPLGEVSLPPVMINNPQAGTSYAIYAKLSGALGAGTILVTQVDLIAIPVA
jgi:hypothetical protein